MSSLKVEVLGFDELVAKIKLLANDADKRREMLILLRQISKPTLAAARTLVPISRKPHKLRGQVIQPGNLKKTLGNITGKSQNPTIYVGARVKGSKKGWYAAFVHDGVNIYNKGYKRKHKKGANNHAAKGSTTGNPFLTNAYEQTKGTVTAEAEKQFAAFIQRRINKLS